eukprot:TRINITY_DN10860_c0_g1_i2.p1 TRINITY_DN10860_c0_g1~~TRINITY_DN10860_c0_g1_i2.p1  ORF type:complete len:790 (-),score=147.02 TRINITY_DN10860_c0_g1_i2:50-2419(-)
MESNTYAFIPTQRQPPLKFSFPNLPPLEQRTVPHQFFHKVTQSPDTDAVFYKDKDNDKSWIPMTWREYQERVVQVAKALHSLKLPASSRVCIITKARIEWNIICIASMLVGLIPTSINSSSPSEQITQILSHCQPTVLFLEKKTHWNKVSDSLSSSPVPRLQHTIFIDSPHPSHYHFRKFLSLSRSVPDSVIENYLYAKLPSSSQSTIAIINYTPSTDSISKGITISHYALLKTCENMFAFLSNEKAQPRAKANNSRFSPSPTSEAGALSFTMVAFGSPAAIQEQVMSVHLPLVHGLNLQVYFCPTILSLKQSLCDIQPSLVIGPFEFWQTIFWGLVEKLYIVNGATSQLPFYKKGSNPALGLEKLTPQQLECLKAVVGLANSQIHLVGGNSQNSGEELFEFFDNIKIPLIEVYGLTEFVGVMRFSKAGKGGDGEFWKGAGFDEDEMKAKNGEVWIKSDRRCLGYWGGSGIGVASGMNVGGMGLDTDGFWSTGDLGVFTEDGENQKMKFLGRKSSEIHMEDGTIVNPMSMETALKCGPLVRNAVIVGNGRKFLTALMILDLNACKRIAKRHKVQAKELLGSEVVKKQMRWQVERASKLSSGGGIRKISIVPRHLSIKQREITPTMSLRRSTILVNWKTEVDIMYKQDDQNAANGKDKRGTFDEGRSRTDGKFYIQVNNARTPYQEIELTQDKVDAMATDTKKAQDEILRLMRELRAYTQKLDIVEKQSELLKREVDRLQARVDQMGSNKDSSLEGKNSGGSTPKATKRERGSKGKVAGQGLKTTLPRNK